MRCYTLIKEVIEGKYLIVKIHATKKELNIERLNTETIQKLILELKKIRKRS